MYSTMYEQPYSYGYRFVGQGRSYVVFEGGGGLARTEVAITQEHPAGHDTVEVFGRGLSLLVQSPVLMQVFREPCTVAWPSQPPILIKLESKSPYHLQIFTQEYKPFHPSRLLIRTQLGHHTDDIALALIETKLQPVEVVEDQFVLPGAWLSKGVHQPEHVAEQQGPRWVFPSREAFRDWAIREIER